MEQQQHRNRIQNRAGDAFQSARPCTVMELGPAQEGSDKAQEKSSAGAVDFTEQVLRFDLSKPISTTHKNLDLADECKINKGPKVIAEKINSG